MARESGKQEAWRYFDRIVAEASPDGVHTNPWVKDERGVVSYSPDFATLERLLAVPLAMDMSTQSGVPALALDVWISHELRRAGFRPDATWPRATHPRILPLPVANLLEGLPSKLRVQVAERIATRANVPGVTQAAASILGKNYFKQVDVIMTDWDTGPELLISTKRMDSSYGKNAANRVEESYGDAKNLRLRHPLAALGFAFCVRSDILSKEPDKAEWLIDLMQKLGREDDAYHATCLLMIEYDDALAPEESATSSESLVESEVLRMIDDEGVLVDDSKVDVASFLATLPSVKVMEAPVPPMLHAATFLDVMVRRVLDAAPVTRHREARARLATPGARVERHYATDRESR